MWVLYRAPVCLLIHLITGQTRGPHSASVTCHYHHPPIMRQSSLLLPWLYKLHQPHSECLLENVTKIKEESKKETAADEEEVEGVAVTRPPCKLSSVLWSPCSRLGGPAEVGLPPPWGPEL